VDAHEPPGRRDEGQHDQRRPVADRQPDRDEEDNQVLADGEQAKERPEGNVRARLLVRRRHLAIFPVAAAPSGVLFAAAMGRAIDELERGRESYAASAWLDAYESLSRADQVEALGAEDLEFLARSAYMVGNDDDYLAGLERAHDLHLAAGVIPPAVRCAFWIGHNLLFRGQTARATGWFGRAQRLLEREARDCVERGYLLIPVWLEQMRKGDYDGGLRTAAQAAEIGERFGEADLVWLARDEQARALANQGRLRDALALVDEVLVAAVANELSPIVTGIVYCNTIAFCRNVYELRHAREWTETLTRWCERQPEMVAHNGLCLVHRAEIMELQGAWDEALEEARQAAERFTRGVLNELACGAALYRQGEIHRLRGEYAAAEQVYKRASRCGYEPQPGLALLRLAEGKAWAAAGAIRRVVGETAAPLLRARLLPAFIEIMLAVRGSDEARAASVELDEIAAGHGAEALEAMAAQARGNVALNDGDAAAALAALRAALTVWQDLAARYELARTRLAIGLACRALRDDDTAILELEAARETFSRLGARPDLARVDALLRRASSSGAYGLTERELEVLRLAAAGRSNREIAAALVISEHTVARHMQNIFNKLGVSSRTAAGAFAVAHQLV
jgi:DNA-binding NarL/FixJ family response regulator